MNRSIRVLHLEDNPHDAELIRQKLKVEGLSFDIVWVNGKEAFESALDREAFDLVLADYNLPDYDGNSALKRVRQKRPELPVIVISGTVGEEEAVECLKAGATDYVLKQRPQRLGAAVTRALAEKGEQGRRREAESALHESEDRFRSAMRFSAIGMALVAPDGRWLDVNRALCRITGYSEEELLARNFQSISHPDDLDSDLNYVRRMLSSEIDTYQMEKRYFHKDGHIVWVLLSVSLVWRPTGEPNYFISQIQDVTLRKLAERSLAQLAAIVESSSDTIVSRSLDGKILSWNAAAERMFGWTAEEAIGRPIWMIIPPTGKREPLIERVSRGETVEPFETIHLRKDGSLFPSQTTLSAIKDEGGKVVSLANIIRDMTERKQQEQKIVGLNRIHTILSSINSAIVRIRDRQQLFQEACRIVVAHGGFSVGWIGVLDHATGMLVTAAQAGLPLDIGAGGDSSDRPIGLVPLGTAEVALREKRPAFDNDIERGLVEMNSESGPDTLSVRRAAVRLGAKSVVVLPLYVEGKTFGVLTLYAPERNFFDDEELKLLNELAGDISFGLEFIAKEEKVDYLAYYDALTGLPNRSLFFDRLTHQIGTAARDGLNVALVLMDLDRFRLINDTLGRQAGDALLNSVAQRIKDSLRDQDTVARVGADSFALAVSGSWQALEVAHFMEIHNRQMFGQPFVLGGEELRVSATAGIAVFPGDGDNPEVLFANAEAALRKAKEQNARFLFYGPEMNARIADSLRLENRLRQALENGEMVLWYQPKVSVKTRKLTGFEALMRWQDPETGMVPPAKFIPLMEQTGLILDAGRWALSQVARDCRLWSASGIKPPRVAVNVSPIQLRQKDFVATVVEAAERTEEAGSMLDLEITESVSWKTSRRSFPYCRQCADAASRSRWTISARGIPRLPTSRGCRLTTSRSIAASSTV